MDKDFIDIKLKFDEDKGYFDIGITGNGDIEADNSFDSTLILALHTDGRASDTEVLSADRQRGTIVDLFSRARNGSKLWLLEQSRNDVSARNCVTDYVKSALSFLVNKGFAKSVDVSAKITAKGIIYSIILYRVNGVTNKYAYRAWDNSIYREN